MLGIILAGGTGSRLGPITKVTSKQLRPVHDKPMIYYPLSLLMASGIREYLIITTPRDHESFKNLFGSGETLGINIEYRIQEKPAGLPDAFRLTSDRTQNQNCTMVLGDNIFYGSKLGAKVHEVQDSVGASIYGYLVDDVSSYGTFDLESNGKPVNLREKPTNGGRGFAIPGLYHFDASVSERASALVPSRRGELEIVDLLQSYLLDGQLNTSILDRGTAWLDTGTVEDMNLASELIRVLQSRQGMLIGSPEEVAYRNNWISNQELLELGNKQVSSAYGKALIRVAESD